MGFLSIANLARAGHRRTMGLKDYLLGRRFVLRSPLPVEDVASRIREAMGNPFNPFHDGVAGWCRFGHLRLRVRVPLLGNGFQPVFSGSFSQDLGRAEVRVRFGASLFLRVILALWYGILSLMVFAILPVVLSGELQTGNEPLGIMLVTVFMVIPMVFIFFYNRDSDAELEQILEFLEEEASFTVQDDRTVS